LEDNLAILNLKHLKKRATARRGHRLFFLSSKVKHINEKNNAVKNSTSKHNCLEQFINQIWLHLNNSLLAI
jgi:hypothetical protein